ncbi:hypothetical protein [Ruminococcus albus]|uniref:PIR Superfamily Protein n=1 Tax=Ruminococcus albus TaxID=1264 RepID=A0A1I1QRL2_RUMAL|nr:hypothetical protein [Ruminococcus albus]SFD24675.1 hypothetical protein SAMN02910406_03482 [Ruminococcus albus]
MFGAALIFFIIDNINELKCLFGFVPEEIEYDDEKLKQYSNNCTFLYNFKDQILNRTNHTSGVVLYSLYYWQHKYIERMHELSYSDASYEQWNFKTMEQIEYTCGKVDLALLEKIENNEI